MANEIIRPSELPVRTNPVPSEVVPSDNNVTVAGVSWEDGVNAAVPPASQSESEAGVINSKRMTPLTTKQAIDAQVGPKISTAINNLNLGTMSQEAAADYTPTSGLAAVALSNEYGDLDNLPTLGTAAAADTGDFAAAAQGALADTAVQPSDPALIPPGGTTSQVLIKSSNTDYDTEWTTSAAATAVSYAPQELTSEQRLQAQSNLSLVNFKTVQLLLADELMSYADEPGKIQVGPGDVIEAGGFRYEVAASDAVDWHVETAGEVRINHIHQGLIDIDALGADIGASAAVNTVAIQKATDIAGGAYGAIHVPRNGYHHNELTIKSHICGHGRLIYDGSGNGMTFATVRSQIMGVTIDSEGNDACLLYVSNSTGIVVGDGATVQNGYNNIVINGVANSLEIGSGASVKFARNDNIFCIQGKRFTVAPDAFILGANGWGINCDSTNAADASQQHGFVLDGQYWGNKAGAVRVVGRSDNLTQHPIISGHLDHNQDDATSDLSYGIYLDYVTRPIIDASLIRTHRTAGLYMDHVERPMVVGCIFWKNPLAYIVTANCLRPMFIGIQEDPAEAGTIADPADAIFVGQDIRSWGDVVTGNGYLKFADIGHLRQFQSGGGTGNAELELNAASGRSVTIRNGAHIDTQLRVRGTIGQRVFSGAPAGTITHQIQARDEDGNLIGNIPVYTT